MNRGMGLIVALSLTACATGPSRGSLEYQDKQVYLCRELCAAGTIEVSRIEGLQCSCAAKKELPFIYNPVQSSGNTGPSREPAGWQVSVPQQVSANQPIYNSNAQPLTIDPTIKDNATQVTTAQGRTIFSQTR